MVIAWDTLDEAKYAGELVAVAELLARVHRDQASRATMEQEAAAIVRTGRASGHRGVVQSFLQEFSLSTREGLALMCLAEAFLRTPDADTRDHLIAESIGSSNWARHVGQSDSVFVNAATWGLMLTGRLVEVDDEPPRDLPGFLQRLAGRIGEPVVRAAVASAVRIMGEQFVLGRTIEAALLRAREENLLCSFDMLGEGARTATDAERYEQAYADALEKIGTAARTGAEKGHGASVKLSASSPRYQATQESRVWTELYPRLLRLAGIAARYDMNLTIDAEESDRLTLSLKLLDRLASAPELGGWRGLGIAVQAYLKCAPRVIAMVAALARDSGRRIMVRLVKGAYWDTEIKHAQIAGRPDYPVYTTKPATDVNYLVCAQALFDAAPSLYPQFATHNAFTFAAIRTIARTRALPFEFQRLHGMGEELYTVAREADPEIRVRTYAPVGSHEALLPYLVRRLLENGANTSFVHVFHNQSVSPEAVVADPVRQLAAHPTRHAKILEPRHIYPWENTPGLDLNAVAERARLRAAVDEIGKANLVSGPIIAGESHRAEQGEPVCTPARLGQVIGHVSDATVMDLDDAIAAARQVQSTWDAAGGVARAEILCRMADMLETNQRRLVALLALEAGRTLADGIAEVREAADFCRYYAHLAQTSFARAEILPSPAGETNALELHGRGVFACISPWNFPLSIFTGQTAAALAAGNAAIAKPAEQTPLIAAEAVRLFHAAGLAPPLVSLIPGRGESIGAALVRHPRIDGVAFTGGTDTARAINRALADREGPIIPFIAETGGLNGMFVDTTALREQVVDDAILSAFGSAGQRCSALRILFLPEGRADELLEGIIGAMDALTIGDPADPGTDVGPLIDQDAVTAMERHASRLAEDGLAILHRLAAPASGHFFGPVLAAIPSSRYLEREVFGPILHVVRYRPDELVTVAADLASRRYGLTLGVHSRVEAFAREVARLVPAGNMYVNRSIIGAVVGAQPFGGEGLSGTGPKAGGPQALSRYAVERVRSVNIAARGGDPRLLEI